MATFGADPHRRDAGRPAEAAAAAAHANPRAGGGGATARTSTDAAAHAAQTTDAAKGAHLPSDRHGCVGGHQQAAHADAAA